MEKMSTTKKILVLGQSGMLAQAIFHAASLMGFETFFLSKSLGADLASSKASFLLSEAFDRSQPRLIFHATGITNLRYCEENPEEAWQLHAH